MAEQSSLLPSNATTFERSLEIARLAGLADQLRHTSNPDKIDIDRLPWLAWGLNVDAWDDEWPEGLKRSTVRRSIHHHRQKGTLAAMRRAARLGGGELIGAFLPSDRSFIGASLSDAERAKWLGRYPELRVYRDRARGKRAGAMPAGPTLSVGAKMFLGGGLAHGTAFPAITDALRRSLPRVYRVAKDGTETELTTVVFDRGTTSKEIVRIEQTAARRGRVLTETGGETLYQIVGPALRGAGAMLGDPAEAGAPPGARLFLGAGRYLTDLRAHKRTYITRFTDTMAQPDAEPRLARAAVQPLLDRARSGIDVALTEGDVMTARAEMKRAQGVRQGMFPSAAYIGRPEYLVDHYAGRRMYLSSRLYDPAVPLPTQGGTFFCGVSRFRMPAYHAEITVRFRRKRPTRAFGQHIVGFPVATESPFKTPLMQGLRTSAALRDKVLLNTKIAGPITAGGEIVAGNEILAGKWRA